MADDDNCDDGYSRDRKSCLLWIQRLCKVFASKQFHLALSGIYKNNK